MRLERAGIALVWQHLALKNVPVPEHEYRLLLSEALAGNVWAGVAEQVPVAIGGVLVPRADLAGTAWLSVIPALGPRRLLAAALLMRRVVRAAAAVHAPGIVCCIRVGNDQGERLGSALGFASTDVRLGDVAEWKLEHGRRRRDDHGQAGAAQRSAG